MEEFPKWKRDLPAFPHKLFNDLMNSVVEFYKEHLRRDIDTGRLKPADYWVMMRGLLIAAAQTYAAICLLLAEKRPKPLMLQAAVLNRALFEILATVMALTEDPVGRTRILAVESYKHHAVRLNRFHARFGSDAKWADYLDVYRRGLAIIADQLQLAPEARSNPSSIPEEWPTPGVMVHGRPSQKIPPFVSGSRHSALKELYDVNDPEQSAQAHGRVASLGVALLVDNPDEQWNPGHGESSLVTSALLFLACILGEIEGQEIMLIIPSSPNCGRTSRDIDDESKDLWRLRYQALAERAQANVRPLTSGCTRRERRNEANRIHRAVAAGEPHFAMRTSTGRNEPLS